MGRADERVVAVFGSSGPREGEEAYEQARAAGGELARLGYLVANGGYGGTMEAVSRGAVEAGGAAMGVVCSVWKARPNRYVQHVVTTASLAERVQCLVELGSSGWLVLPGATGTLVELAWVWERLCKGLMPRRPLVCLGEFWRPVIDLMAAARPRSERVISVIRRPEELAGPFPPDRWLA